MTQGPVAGWPIGGPYARPVLGEVPRPAYSPGPAGFERNGAPNLALANMLYDVAQGRRRGRITFLGDSTTVGSGGGTDNGSGGFLGGAAAQRPPAVFARVMTQRGYRTLDQGFVGTGTVNNQGFSLAQYDPRFDQGMFEAMSGQPVWPRFSGGGTYRSTGSGLPLVANVPGVDTYEVDFYQTDFRVIIPGGDFSGFEVLSNLGGFRRLTLRRSGSSGTRLELSPPGDTYLRGIVGYDSTVRAADVRVAAANGVGSGPQASRADNLSLNALEFDAPDLTVINHGLNDMFQGVAVSAYGDALQAMVTSARRTGDVLLVFPHPAEGDFNRDVALYKAEMRRVAQANAVSMLSLHDYFGGQYTQALRDRMVDGVHPGPGMYEEIGGVLADSAVAMSSAQASGARTLAVDPLTASAAGTPTALLTRRRALVDRATAAVSPRAVDLRRRLLLTSAVRSYSTAHRPVSLLARRRLSADPRAASVALTPTALLARRLLPVAALPLTAGTVDVGFGKGTPRLRVDPLAAVAAASPAALLLGRRVAADPRVAAAVNRPATLLLRRRLVGEPGAFLAVARPVQLSRSGDLPTLPPAAVTATLTIPPRSAILALPARLATYRVGS